MWYCKKHPRYRGKSKPKHNCESCWSGYFSRIAYEKCMSKIREAEKANPGWVYGSRDWRQLGVYDG